MSRLLSANFKRMLKDKFFWIGTAFMIIMGVVMPIIQYVDMKKDGYQVDLDNGFFAFALYIAIISPILCSLFIGTEYSDNTMRNKVGVGHTRIAIYLSNIIVCIAANISMILIHIIIRLCIGIPMFGFLKSSTNSIIALSVCSLLLVIALTSIFTFISMINKSKAISAIVCILCSFALIIIGSYLESRLSEPETYSGLIYTENGLTEMAGEPNPNYPAGTKRKVYEFLFDFLPGGQVIQISSIAAQNSLQMSMFSAIIIVVSTGLGLYLFSKKDLN